MRLIFMCFLFYSFLHANIVVDKEEPINLLSGSELFVDVSGKMKADELVSNLQLFKSIDEPFLNFGYILGQAVWIKFTLENQTDNILHRTVLIDNTMLDFVELFKEEDKKAISLGIKGVFPRQKFDGTLMFSFPIVLDAKSTATYYYRIYTQSCPAWFKLELTSKKDAIKKDVTKQVVFALFFGAMLALTVYNFFLFLFTRERIYLFYVLYLISIVMEHETYTGMILYWLPMDNREFVDAEAYFGIHYVNIVTFMMTLFTKEFLNTALYPKIDKLMWVLLSIPLVSSAINTREFYLLDEVMIYNFLLLIILWIIGIYAKIQKNTNASYYIVGWSLSISAWVVLILHNLGIWSVQYIFNYTFEVLVMAEALLFSVALANRLNKLNEEKTRLSNKLIVQQQNEKAKLESTVKERTAELNVELKNNELLLRELHHRVKNNMQFITSLYALKLHNIADTALREKLNDVERKIQAMSYVHEMLYKENNLAKIDTKEYFNKLIKSVKAGYDTLSIDFGVDVDTNLGAQEAIYVGLIVNELIINALKYAFLDNGGTILISLHDIDGAKELVVSDDGVGLKENNKKSFGFLMIETLAIQQLEGTIEVDAKDGTSVKIRF